MASGYCQPWIMPSWRTCTSTDMMTPVISTLRNLYGTAGRNRLHRSLFDTVSPSFHPVHSLSVHPHHTFQYKPSEPVDHPKCTGPCEPVGQAHVTPTIDSVRGHDSNTDSMSRQLDLISLAHVWGSIEILDDSDSFLNLVYSPTRHEVHHIHRYGSKRKT